MTPTSNTRWSPLGECSIHLPGNGRHHRSGSPKGNRRKTGSQAQAIRRPAGNCRQSPRGGRSRGGLATRIVALVDAPGNMIRFLLLPGQAHDIKGVAPLIRNVAFGALLADKAFDANWLLQELDRGGAAKPPLPVRRGAGDHTSSICLAPQRAMHDSG